MPIRYKEIDNRITYGKIPLKSIMKGSSCVYGEDKGYSTIFTYTTNNEDISITGLTDAGKQLSAIAIPSQIASNDVVTIANEAFSNCDNLTSIVIPDSIKSIGNSGFSGCTAMISVTIGKNVTSIGQWTFRNCGNLKEVNWDAVSVEDFFAGKGVFYNAGTAGDGITVIFGDSVQKIPAYTFDVNGSSNDANIKTVIISNSVTSIGTFAFSGCRGLTSVDIPESVTSIGAGVFSGSADLVSVVVAEGNSVYHSDNNCIIETASKALIAGCAVSIIPSDGSVTSIGDSAFYGFSSLALITIPDGVKSIGKSAFRDCSGLTAITIPDSVTSIGDYAFDNCSSLSSVTIGNGVTSIGYMSFMNCLALNSVIYNGTISQWRNISLGQYWNQNCPFTKVQCTNGTVSV